MRTFSSEWPDGRIEPGPQIVLLNGIPLDPGPSQKIRNHSPTGFSWGYGGSGPAQLALAILNEVLGREIAEKHYQNFKWEFVAKWRTRWSITDEEVVSWYEARCAQDEQKDLNTPAGK